MCVKTLRPLLLGVLAALAPSCSDDASTDAHLLPPDDSGVPDKGTPLPDGPPPKGTYSEVTLFGSNPGNLKMHKYVPGAMPAGPAPLVVILHGCQVTAAEHVQSSGWNDLADRRKLLLVYPEQSPTNNPNTCFNWFQLSDYAHDQGEAKSVVQMVEQMKKDHAVDDKRVFVTGLSAGAAMAVDLGAVYPDLFAGVAAMAGIPFGCATDAVSALSCMSGTDKPPTQWGDLVRKARPGYSGPYPTMAVFHGDKDGMIDHSLLNEIAEQWLDLHKTDTTPEVSDAVQGHPHQVFHDSGQNPVVETFLLTGMGHGIAVDPGTGPQQGGQTSWFSYDVNLWSTYHAALFWGLLP